MQYQDVLVYLDEGESNQQRIDAAIAFAKPHDARLVGVALQLEVPAHIAAIVPTSLLQTQRQATADNANALVGAFRKQAQAAGITVETHVITTKESGAAGRLAMMARDFDVSILRQANPDSPNASLSEAVAEAVLFDSGRPVFFMPYIGAHRIPCRRAVVAWDGGRAASRAVHDALPLLERMEEVIVLVISSDDHTRDKNNRLGDALTAHLVRHGISARLLRVPANEVDASVIVLNTLADTGADMLIMGGYGTSKLHEMVLGGVTRTVLHDMTVPVFMAH